MKRLILLTVVAAFITVNLSAQDGADAAPILLNHKTLLKKADKSDAAIVDEKKSIKANTWTSRARVFQDIDNLGLEQAQLGMDKTTLQLFYKDMISSETLENDIEVLIYPNIKYHMENGRLRGWEPVNPISDTPLTEALRSYKKAIELTEEEKQAKLESKIKPNLDELKDQFKRQGQNKYFFNDFESALTSFESIIEVNKIAVYNGLIDTLMINYSGIVARELGRMYMADEKKEEGEKMYRKTIDYYTQLADIGFGGSSGYVQMTRDFYAIGDTLGAIENLKKGIEKYPDSTLLVTVCAQAYYLTKDNEGGLGFIAERLEEKPTCPAAYYWKGLLITNVPDVSEDTIKIALALYDTSLMYDPTNASVSYQSGYVNYAVGANYFEQESYEEDAEYRKELNDKGVVYYEAAIDKLEQTYKNAGTDNTLVKESLDLLKRIYYKLYGGEDERYLGVNKRLNEL